MIIQCDGAEQNYKDADQTGVSVTLRSVSEAARFEWWPEHRTLLAHFS
jgi:hypothetical protein